MRRKLIKQEAFDLISKSSANMAAKELSEASDVLAKALGKDSLSLHSFNDNIVVYETCEDTYVHAGYEIKNGEITFNNVEELVIDESSQKQARRKVIGEMLDSIVRKDESKAKSLFDDYKRTINWNESRKAFEFVAKSEKEDEEGDSPFPPKKDKFSTKSKKDKAFDKKKKFPFGVKKGEKDKEDHFEKLAKAAGKEVKEAYTVAKNVLEYVDYFRVGPALAETVIRTDETGNVTDVKVPVAKSRNEAAIIKLKHTNLKGTLQTKRSKAALKSEDQAFCKAIYDLKRCNAYNDPKTFEEQLGLIVKNWPEVIYLTQGELSQVLGEALNMLGVTKYDDQICDFLSEGILRRAHGTYIERVGQILKLAGAPKMEESVDAYDFFQAVVEQFYPAIDEQFGLERKVYADLYQTLASIFKAAERSGNDGLKSEAAGYLNALAGVLNDEVKPTIELAEEAASWLGSFVEANLAGASNTWSVSNKAHTTFSGDHPSMAKLAKVDGNPAKFPGDWGDEAPMISQDKKGYKGNSEKARNSSWGNIGGKDTYPSVKNPYIPKPFGDYTMKGEKGVDKEPTGNFHASIRNKDTWPELKNPNVPKEQGGTGGKGYKMKNGSETDLVVDK